MNIIITNKKADIKDDKKELIIRKFNKLGKFFSEETDAHVTLSEQREYKIVEVTIVYHGLTLRSEQRNLEFLDAADKCIAALDRQIRKNKTKLAKRYHSGGFENYDIALEGSTADIEEDEFKIIKVKKVSSKPMMVEEAILQMNMLGHDFFIFNNPETDNISIVYKRKDGNYGLLETD